MKPALFIDFDGTLCHDRFWRSLKPKLQKEVQQYFFVQNQDLVNAWMKGIVDSETINRKIAEDLKIDYATLWDVFVKDCENMSVERKTLERIGTLRKKYVTILITDNMDCFDRFTIPALKLESYFDHIVNSCNEKTFKNDIEGRLFHIIAERNNLDLQKSILIDNSEKVCAVFEKLGGIAFLVTGKESLISYLEEKIY